MEQAIPVILICINLAVFFLYGEDKRRSIRGGGGFQREISSLPLSASDLLAHFLA